MRASAATVMNPEQAASKQVVLHTNQFKMKFGGNAPQHYQYPVNLFTGGA
jgi:hypothetical protein